MQKIAITGAKGVIGTVLQKYLKTTFKITPINRPKIDVRNYSQLIKIFPSHDAVIHLAWDLKTEDFGKITINPDNILMTYNVYQAAVETKIKRVIMASSIHADSYLDTKTSKLLTPDKLPTPDSPYGASKVFMEALGRYYALKFGLEVVCIRFGGVNKKDSPEVPEKDYKKVFLSHRDCANLVRACLKAKKVPHNFVIIYGVSNNSNRVHDFSNPFGWTPQDNAQYFISTPGVEFP